MLIQSWALAEAAEGNTERARDMLRRATSVQPRSVPCWHAWAKLEVTNGNMDKARELYLKALQLDPRGTVTYSEPSISLRLLHAINHITICVLGFHQQGGGGAVNRQHLETAWGSTGGVKSAD